MIIVSTDGSCLRNPGGAIGWAWVNHQGTSLSGGAATGTNQIAELRAVLEAILAHPGDEPLFIESDSLYAIKCASEWISGWRLNGWRTSTGGAVKNVDLIKQIDRAIATRPGPVRFRWVRGHVGNYYNEQADALAGAAARQAAASAAGAATPDTADPVTPEPELPKDRPAERETAKTAQKTARPRATGKTVTPTAAQPQALTLF